MKIFLNKNKAFLLILITLLFSFFGCSHKPQLVLIKIPENSRTIWETIITNFPVPENFILDYESPEITNMPKIILSESNSDSLIHSKNVILLEKTFLVPVTNFWNPLNNTSITDLTKYKLIPMEKIKLPLKGLSIEGLYPEDEGYSAYKLKLLSLSFPDDYSDETSLNELNSWFQKIKNIYDQTMIQPPKISWIAGVGDMMVQRGVESILMNRESGTEYIFGDTLNILKNQDFMLGNLEGSITYSTNKTSKSYNFRFNPNVLPYLKQAGFDYLSITNNHIYDYGEKGFKDTLKYLKKSEIPTSGAGLTKKEALEYYETTLNNNTVRVLSLGAYPQEKNGWNGRTMAQVSDTRPGILFDGESALNAVREMSGESSIDILMIHGGVEWSSVPKEKQIELYRSYIDAGADIIFGSHPHVLQGMEEWQGKLISYSLGNFIFPGMSSMKFAEESMILSLGIIDNKIKYIKQIPVNINNRRISIDTSGKILERFQKLTTDLVRSK